MHFHYLYQPVRKASENNKYECDRHAAKKENGEKKVLNDEGNIIKDKYEMKSAEYYLNVYKFDDKNGENSYERLELSYTKEGSNLCLKTISYTWADSLSEICPDSI